MKVIDPTYILSLHIDLENQDNATLFMRIKKGFPVIAGETITIEPSINLPFKNAIVYKVSSVENPLPSSVKGLQTQTIKLTRV
ncbi:hypothetical protein [Flavobacterium sp.]|uniref:hypothetical protein n=1 Tax=Flavobacterium sp. TaxID=239 RepID=UPI003751EA20